MATEVLTVETFDASKIVFDEPKQHKFNTTTYYRIPVKYLTEDGKKIQLNILTPELTSWGVKENTSSQDKLQDKQTENKPVESYSLPLVMNDEPFMDVLNQILKKTQEHLLKSETIKLLKKGKDSFGPFVNILDIVYRPKEAGELVAGAVPTMYPKLYDRKSKDRQTAPKITTPFFDTNDEEVDPLDLLEVRFKCMAAITVYDIYVSQKPSIQLKVNDVTVLERLANRKRLVPSCAKKPPANVFSEEKDSDSEDSESESEPSPKKATIVKRREPETEKKTTIVVRRKQ